MVGHKVEKVERCQASMVVWQKVEKRATTKIIVNILYTLC